MAVLLPLLTLIFPMLVLAANNASSPCFDGKCSYELSGAVPGTISISGNSSAISDLTAAAGWAMLDCESGLNSTSQTVRAVCTNTTGGCAHLYQGGAVGTIVRLPQNCTPLAFARVAEIWDHENQTSPYTRRSSRFFRRDASPIVQGILLDTSFSSVDSSQNGNISFSFQGTSVPSANSEATPALSRRTSGSFSQNDTQNVPPIMVNKQVTLFNETALACPTGITIDGDSLACEVNIAAEFASNLQAFYGISVAGSLVPPSLSDFSLFAGMNGSLDGTLIVNSSAQITLDTGAIPIFSIGIPGLDIPGILSIGPTFTVNVEGIATLDAKLDTTFGLSLNVDNAEFFIPPSSNQGTTGDIMEGSSSLHLIAVDPSVSADASITAEIFPSIAFGITAFDDVADATVSLDLDLFATLELSASDTPAMTSKNYTSDGFAGCVDLLGGVNVTAAADATLFGLLDDSKSVTLFSKEFNLFQKCF